MKPFFFLLIILAMFTAVVTPSYAAQVAPSAYEVVINPSQNTHGPLMKGEVDGVKIKGWWLEVNVDGQPLKDFLQSHPNSKFVISNTDTKIEVSTADYLKDGLHFPIGNVLVNLTDENGAAVITDLKVGAGGGLCLIKGQCQRFHRWCQWRCPEKCLLDK
jgi:hypothetical protein